MQIESRRFNLHDFVFIYSKASTAPQPTKGFYRALEILQPHQTFIVAPINSESYKLQENITVCSLKDAIKEFKSN
jgi:hypothetical protein